MDTRKPLTLKPANAFDDCAATASALDCILLAAVVKCMWVGKKGLHTPHGTLLQHLCGLWYTRQDESEIISFPVSDSGGSPRALHVVGFLSSKPLSTL